MKNAKPTKIRFRMYVKLAIKKRNGLEANLEQAQKAKESNYFLATNWAHKGWSKFNFLLSTVIKENITISASTTENKFSK